VAPRGCDPKGSFFLEIHRQPHRVTRRTIPAGDCRRREVTVFNIELEEETDGRWLAEVTELPGVMCYGADKAEAVAKVQALALRVVADRLEHEEGSGDLLEISFNAA